MPLMVDTAQNRAFSAGIPIFSISFKTNGDGGAVVVLIVFPFVSVEVMFSSRPLAGEVARR